MSDTLTMHSDRVELATQDHEYGLGRSADHWPRVGIRGSDCLVIHRPDSRQYISAH